MIKLKRKQIKSFFLSIFFIFVLIGLPIGILLNKYNYETQRNQLLTEQTAINVEQEFLARINFLRILQVEWTNSKTPEEILDNDTFYSKIPIFFNLIEGITAISLINSSGYITYRFPYNETIIGTPIYNEIDGTNNTALSLANSTKNITLSQPKILHINEMGYVLYSPLLYNNTVLGFLNIVFTIDEFIDNYIRKQQLLKDFNLEIWDNGTIIYHYPVNTFNKDIIHASTHKILGRTLDIYIIPYQNPIFNIETLIICGLWTTFIGLIIYYKKSLEKKNFSLQKAIQEKTETEEKLRQAAKLEAVGRLAGGIAHDFNNILMAIQGFTELSLLDLRNPETLENNLKETQNAINRAINLVKQLLVFSLKQKLNLKPIDLNERIIRIQDFLKRLIREDIEFELLLNNQEKMSIYADPLQIETVIINLIINACDSIIHNGKITIETSSILINIERKDLFSKIIPIGKYIILSIIDNGQGMTQDTMNHLFEPFFTTKDSSKGTGLGLSIVYGIVNESKGYINVSSEINKGSTFTLYFPKCPLKSIEQSKDFQYSSEFIKREHPNMNYKILIVEDEESIQKLIIEFLSKSGFQTITASNGKDALDLVNQYKSEIKMIITDIIMPKMGGNELVDIITKEYPEIKILFISGYTKHLLNEADILDHKVNFLQKPFTINELNSKIDSILHLK